MNLRWHDVSIPMRPEMTVWPGDNPFKLDPAARIAEGSSCNTSVLRLGTHTGTHCDAPWHFDDDGKRLEAVDTALFFGGARVIHLPDVDRIQAEHLGDAPLPERVLFKTRNSDLPSDGAFAEDYVALDECAAERLVLDGVRLVGVDYLSVAPYGDAAPVHHILLRAEVFIVEGLRLREIPAGAHPFVVLPMPLQGADGAPCRAFIGLPPAP